MDKILPMLGFEPRDSDIGSDRSTNLAVVALLFCHFAMPISATTSNDGTVVLQELVTSSRCQNQDWIWATCLSIEAMPD